uniref:Periplasmic heavy metal sensor n=1 Tax=candidate division WOR-3 bacterium TaxID=2052148 RepID=A0A7C4CDC5_UNCW3
MQSRWLVVVVVASLALNVAVVGTYLFERSRLRPPGPPLPGMRPALVRELRELRREFEPRMDTLRERARLAREGLMELALQAKPDMARADSLLAEISRSETAMNRLAFEHARRVGNRLPEGGRAAFLRRLRERQLRPCGMMIRRGLRRPPPPDDDFDEKINP